MRILGEYRANFLRLKSPARSDFGLKKNFPRPHKLAVCCMLHDIKNSSQADTVYAIVDSRPVVTRQARIVN